MPIGGSCTADVSSGVNVSGRCVTQTWSIASTNTAVTEPMIQSFGISSGQLGSTSKDGIPSLSKSGAPLVSRLDPQPATKTGIRSVREKTSSLFRLFIFLMLTELPVRFLKLINQTVDQG